MYMQNVSGYMAVSLFFSFFVLSMQALLMSEMFRYHFNSPLAARRARLSHDE